MIKVITIYKTKGSILVGVLNVDYASPTEPISLLMYSDVTSVAMIS